MIIISILTFGLVIWKTTYQCLPYDDDMSTTVQNYMFLVIITLVNLLCICAYMYARNFFKKYYLKFIQINQDVIDQDQIDDMKTSVKFLSVFMFTISWNDSSDIYDLYDRNYLDIANFLVDKGNYQNIGKKGFYL
ncbi:UNKNOWN [Stylonychia lemnae]|uniref:Uncharacterized protein n=1 Tax=Stylonychia lemnae TaxID=5949 RepID=A0A078AQ52_STYLE|nr:UNKNOWN [Stylonychia lemnae]|eukprot:CDW84299.1 UNKNOWN [Stylonychia lemnae]